MTLKDMIRGIGPQFSPIKSVLYSWIFITCNFVLLLLQAIGGGVAASANTNSRSTVEGRIMFSSIDFYIVIFTFLYDLMASFIFNLQCN